MSSSFICTSTSRSSPVPAPPPPPPPTCENTHFWVPKDSLVTKSNSAFLSLNYLPFSLFGAFNFPIPSASGDLSVPASCSTTLDKSLSHRPCVPSLQGKSCLDYVHACMLSCFSHVLLCVTLRTVCCRPSSSAHGILQARALNQVVMPSSRGSSLPRDQTQVSYIS